MELKEFKGISHNIDGTTSVYLKIACVATSENEMEARRELAKYLKNLADVTGDGLLSFK